MARVLIVVTSHRQLGSSRLPTGVGLQTFAAPYYVLTEAGVEVAVASVQGGEPPIDPLSFGEGVETVALERLTHDTMAMAMFRDPRPLSTLSADEYDGLFFAGGHGGMWDLPDNPTVATLIAAALDAGTPVAAVCHGVAALCGRHPRTGHPLVQGRKVTALTTQEEVELGREGLVPFLLEERLVELGAVFDEAPVFTSHVVTDGSLITGQNMRSADHASRSLLAALAA
ncbi:type 1 glutamine amidotransferase domain-containing protein [Mumia sp. Pv 4-285]|uniref:type 1 glutamine amidotransferase domain-containing protein n=1 Tax=Mumia qirimensis TaxID=3234852 RepID=UPI00351D0B86